MSAKSTLKWYVALGPNPEGPFDIVEMRAALSAEKIKATDFVSTSPKGPWTRLNESSEWSEINSNPKSKVEIKKTSKKSDHPEWFLYFNQAQHGPYKKSEILEMLKDGKLNERVHAWKDGMSGWERLESIKEIKAKEATTSGLWKSDKMVQDARSAPRKPLVARIFAANEKVLSVGVCRDISVGGMQVLTEKIPGSVGEKIKLNVSPSGTDKLEPFVAHGKIVRLHEDGRGFSFRFEKLDTKALKSIEKYIASLED